MTTNVVPGNMRNVLGAMVSDPEGESKRGRSSCRRDPEAHDGARPLLATPAPATAPWSCTARSLGTAQSSSCGPPLRSSWARSYHGRCASRTRRTGVVASGELLSELPSTLDLIRSMLPHEKPTRDEQP